MLLESHDERDDTHARTSPWKALKMTPLTTWEEFCKVKNDGMSWKDSERDELPAVASRDSEGSTGVDGG